MWGRVLGGYSWRAMYALHSNSRIHISFHSQGIWGASIPLLCKCSQQAVPSKPSKRKSRTKPADPKRQPLVPPFVVTRIDKFFASYPTFISDTTKPVEEEWARLQKHFGWDKLKGTRKAQKAPNFTKAKREGKGMPMETMRSAEREEKAFNKAREAYKEALVLQFNEIYGDDISSIEPWKKLCQVVRLADIPHELDACRELVGRTHVNLVDLVGHGRTGLPVQTFSTVEELSAHTICTEKYFPREHAKAGGVLRYLLRHIIDPSKNREARRRGKRKGGS